jgi:spore coat assembly protein SafA
MLKDFFKPNRWMSMLVIGGMLLATLGLTSLVSAKATCSSPYTVQSGDTLKSIAQKCGVSLNALLNANPAITNPNLIYRGQRIVIPGGSSDTIKYTVQPGDTLQSIANRYDVTIGLILLKNPQITDPTQLTPGQVITIPVVPVIPETGASPALQLSLYSGLPGTNLTISGSGFPARQTIYVSATSNGVSSSAATNATTNTNGNFSVQLRIPSDAPSGSVWVVNAFTQSANNPLATATFQVINLPASGAYVVQSGDTLSKIAQRYHTSVNALLRANPQISNPNRLQPGDLIYLPGSVLVDPNTGLTFYIVQSGDYLGSIAVRFGVSISALLAANPQIQNPSLIYPGARITIPSGGTIPVSGSGPQLQIAPKSGQPGSQVSVVGSGFPGNVTVYVSASLQGQAPSVTVEATSDANGNFTTQLTIPSTAVPGDNWVISASTATASAGFNVVGPAPSGSYTVHSGDTITSIAQRFGIPVHLIELANPQISNFSNLTLGQQITIPARISFAAGGTSAVVTGSLNAGSDAYYVLRAGNKQLLEVTTSSPDPNLQMAIYAANGSTIKSLASNNPNFRGYLPGTQDYLLVVHASQNTTFSLNVDIPARISFAAGAISASVSGTLAPHASQYYVLRAMNGQQLQVSVTPQNMNMRLVIYGFDGTVLRSGMGGPPSFTGTLPGTQDYLIVLTASDQPISYRMNVTIPAP